MSQESVPSHIPREHSEVKMEGMKLFECEECGEILKSNSRLIQHLLSHRGATVFCCEECEEVFLSESQLDQHTLAIHTAAVQTFECDECGKCLASQRSLIAHKNMHNDERDYKCEECGKEFTSRKNLTQHLRVHSEREFECQECGLKFKWRGDLARHIRNIHSGIANHFCSFCGKGFVRKRHLERHVIYSHGNEESEDIQVITVTDVSTST